MILEVLLRRVRNASNLVFWEIRKQHEENWKIGTLEHWNSDTGKSGILLKRKETEPKFTQMQFIRWPFSNETD